MADPIVLAPPGQAERDARIQSALNAKLEAIAQRAEEKALAGLAEMIGKAEQPERPVILGGDGREVLKTEVPWRGEYRRFTGEEGKIRNPDSDHWMAEFLRGVAANDRVQVAQASAKLDALFPHMRADTLEGAAGASGAFAAGSGGTLLPRPLEALVAVARDRVAKLHRYATTYTMTSQTVNIPTGAAMTAYMQDEATSPTTTGLTFSQVQLAAYNAIAKAVIGNDMLADTAINVVSFIANRGGAALGVLEDQQFFAAGTGSAPNVTKMSGTAYVEATTNALAFSDVVGMYTGLQQEYRPNARWFINPTVLGYMANVRDGMGRQIYNDLLSRPLPIGDDDSIIGTLLGKPVHEAPLTAGDVWFGDPAATYAIGRREGITIEVSREFLFDTRRTMFLIRQRIAGNNLETVSAKLCSGITSATSL